MKKKLKEQVPDTVEGAPVKGFFVDMLIRDISLSDAILDLLDNCVDGILRSPKSHRKGSRPYSSFSADIRFSKDRFSISDDCGGIPWSQKDYAFRLGRSRDQTAEHLPTVGVYGIGMKRAIFKLGRDARVLTQHGKVAFEVTIDPNWMDSEDEWHIPLKRLNSEKTPDGTVIEVRELRPGVKERFDTQAFVTELYDKISSHYAFIIEKGFSVSLNGQVVKPKPTALRFGTEKSGKGIIRPFIYKDCIDGVDVFLAVGFTSPILTEDDVREEMESVHYSSTLAGWTVICNDRAVVYCDRTELTGWGEAGVPRYHTQFTAIAGIVEFRCNDASKLPTTTTKRGIDASSTLYLKVKNKMREGMKMFTDFTNKWKGPDLTRKAQRMISKAERKSLPQLKQIASSGTVTLRKVPRSKSGQQFKPKLPLPKVKPEMRRISYSRHVDDIRELSEALFNTDDMDPSSVGEKCFDLKLKEIRK